MSNELSESESARTSEFRLPVWTWLTLWTVLVAGTSMAAHYAVHGVVNGWQVTIAFFLATNIMICWWEISLGARIGLIEYWHHDPAGRAERPPASVFMSRASLREVVSTRLPSIFFLVGMTAGMVPPVVLGLVGALIFYQKLYCTSVYLAAYLFNRRYEGRSLAWVIAIVGGTNGIWIVFPAISLYVCIRLVLENRFDLLWS
jgi:hypothetical protein